MLDNRKYDLSHSRVKISYVSLLGVRADYDERTSSIDHDLLEML